MQVEVRLRVGMAGVNVAYKPGDTIPVTLEVAEAWRQAGIADIVPAEAKPQPEGATNEPTGGSVRKRRG